MTILDEFVRLNLLDRSVAAEIEKEIAGGKIMDELLIRQGISAEKVFEVKSAYYNIPIREASDEMVAAEIIKFVPEKSAKHYKFVPIGITNDNELEIGILNPDNLQAQSALQFISGNSGMAYKTYLISFDYYKFIIDHYSGAKGEVKEALGELDIAEISAGTKKTSSNSSDGDSGERIIEDAPITKIVSNILKFAAEKYASDIHIEPWEKEITVRYRIDGVMEKQLSLPKKVHSSVIARIKILSQIKLDEKRIPQDGRFSAKLLNRKIDFRVSSFPTYFGEKVVMRLLESDRGAMNLSELGFSDENMASIQRAISNSYGIVLICGPTGSGKTNTLYSLLNEMDRDGENVLSLENPIELNIPGVSQSQMRPEIGYTFASGLRSVLRQDPDIIMVGEIRDTETAKLAIQAALTGHLVLSTIHTNTTADVVQRLVDMGVEPYLIGPTLIAAVGQRLVRRIAPDSAKESPISEAQKAFIKRETDDLPEEFKAQYNFDKMYEAVPSKKYPAGTKGRMGVFEVMEMDSGLEEILLKDPSSLAISRYNRSKGFRSFTEDAIIKAHDGKIPFEEVLKL